MQSCALCSIGMKLGDIIVSTLIDYLCVFWQYKNAMK